MAKVQFNLDSNANIHSCKKTGWLDTVKDCGLAEGEWENYTEDDKQKLAEEWMVENISIWYEEKE